jgi:trehalose 6-phosphate phosphatase
VRYALSATGLEQIDACVAGKTLLAFDIDGTLAPIVDRPWNARVPDDVQRSLATLAARRPVAVITGRAVNDARPMLGFSPRYLIGNHGAEGVPGFERAAVAFARVCRGWLDELSADGEDWRALPGVTLEDKTCSLAFHYRGAPDQRRAQELLAERVQRLVPAPSTLDDKCVLNLVPPGAPDKGDALGALLVHSRCERALYVGDDVSDEAVFRLRSPLVLTVRVEHHPKSAADLYLKNQGEVPRLVQMLSRMLVRPTRARAIAVRRSETS